MGWALAGPQNNWLGTNRRSAKLPANGIAIAIAIAMAIAIAIGMGIAIGPMTGMGIAIGTGMAMAWQRNGWPTVAHPPSPTLPARPT